MDEVIVRAACVFGGLVVGVGIGLWFGGARIQEERVNAYQRGRDGAFRDMARHRGRHMQLVARDEDLSGQAESRGPITQH